MKKYFLSSMLVMGLMAPAFGADGKITGGAGTCTVDVLGVYDNNATANTIATWALNDYKCGTGQYLVVDGENIACQPCPAGSYCPGGTYTVENADEGTNACPTGYKNSDAGASSNTQCYTNCTVANANIEHATAVTGNDYYGAGTDTCAATDCDLGYHVESDLEFYEKTPLVPVDHKDFYYSGAYVNAFGEFYSDSFSEAELTENNTWANKMGDDIVYGRASCQPQRHNEDLQQILKEYAAQVENGTMTLEEYQSAVASVTDPGTAKFMAEALKWSLVISSGNVTNENPYEVLARLILMSEEYYIIFDKVFDVDYSTNSSGKYCYCQLTDFVPAGGSKQPIVSAPWVKKYDFDSAESCAYTCTHFCSGMSQGDDLGFNGYTAALFDAMDYRLGGGMCKITENNCPAGQYLAVVGDAMMCVPCKSGSYCPGGVYTIESENKGTNACPTTHPNSDAGAGADTQCYTACTLETANIAHATAVSGNDYYGAGTDTCSATACATGYHPKGEIQFVEKTPSIPLNYTVVGDGYAYVRADGSTGNNSGLTDAGLTENNTWASYFDYGTIYGRASCQPEFGDEQLRLLFYGLSSIMSGAMSIDDFKSLMESNLGMVKAKLATDLVMSVAQNGPSGLTDDEYKKLFSVFMAIRGAQYDTSSTGAYCFCKADYLKDKSGNRQYIESAPWVALYQSAFDGWNADRCAVDCAELCSDVVRADNEGNDAFRGALFGILDYAEMSTCAANTINIDWNPDNGGAHTQNMCLYDGAITLPDDPVRPGFTFAGWKLVE